MRLFITADDPLLVLVATASRSAANGRACDQFQPDRKGEAILQFAAAPSG